MVQAEGLLAKIQAAAIAAVGGNGGHKVLQENELWQFLCASKPRQSAQTACCNDKNMSTDHMYADHRLSASEPANYHEGGYD